VTNEIAVMIPIVSVLAIAGSICLSVYLKFRSRVAVQETIRAAIAHGQALTPDLIEQLGEPPRTPHTDLRRGVVLIAVGLGIAAFGATLDEEEAVRPLIAIGAVPFLLGVAFLGLWRFMPRS